MQLGTRRLSSLYKITFLSIYGYIHFVFVSALYSKLFPKTSDAAMACFNFLNSIGFALSFGLSSFLCSYVKLVIVLSTLVLSTICVLIVTLHKRRSNCD